MVRLNEKGGLIVAIGILIVLNIWLLFNNHQKDEKIEELYLTSSQTKWRYETVDSTLLHISNDEITVGNTSLSLIVFFSDQGCQSCIKDEVNLLNEKHSSYEDLTKVYLLSKKAPTYLSRMFGATFDYQVIDPKEAVFDIDFEFVNPVAVLTDSTGLVHRIHKAEVGNKKKSEEFYKQMFELFDDMQNKHGR
jgi:hypothetical protein